MSGLALLVFFRNSEMMLTIRLHEAPSDLGGAILSQRLVSLASLHILQYSSTTHPAGVVP